MRRGCDASRPRRRAASPSTASSAGRSATGSPASKRGPARRARSAARSIGNAHFGGRLISELIVAVIARDADVASCATCRSARWSSATTAAACSGRGEILLSADFACRRGEPGSAARRRARVARVPQAHAAARRRRAPAASSRTRIRRAIACPTGIPRSAGALVDRAGLKGAREGGARVSPTHGNFIVNEGGATAARHPRADRALQGRASATRFGVELREEIVYLGASRDADAGRRSRHGDTAGSKAAAGCRAGWRSKATRTRRCRCSRRAC